MYKSPKNQLTDKSIKHASSHQNTRFKTMKNGIFFIISWQKGVKKLKKSFFFNAVTHTTSVFD